MSQLLDVRAPVGNRSLQAVAGAMLLAVLAMRFGLAPFLDGLGAAGPRTVAVALVVTAGTTYCCALRWTLVTRRLGGELPIRTAYATYYRSQLLNVTLPGGVVGDVYRGVRHGWRAVLWERGIGQVVQLGLIGSLLLPGGWRWVGLSAVCALVVAGGAITVLSALSTTGHLLVFLAAATAVGVQLSLPSLIVVGALVLLGASIPLNVAGWGPREGMAAWAFAAFGSTAGTGLTVAVAYGVVSMLATLPGLALLGRRDD
ncbi:MAG: lysylphosphatidylglycerol synthase domain-containing protein [Marmoricola sp.]